MIPIAAGRESAPLPTEVPKALATSLAPIPNPLQVRRHLIMFLFE